MRNQDQKQYLKKIGYTESIHSILRVFVNNNYLPLSAHWFVDEGVIGDAYEVGWLDCNEKGFFCLSEKAPRVLITLVKLRG